MVDDGSTDASAEIASSFSDKVKLHTGPNQGACAARNTGVELATGEFIQFLDSDDLLHPSKVERCLERLSLHDENSLVYTMHEVVSLDGFPAQQWNRRDSPEDAIRFMLRGDLPTPSPLHRKANINAIGGFRSDLPCAQDRDFHIRMALHGVHFIAHPEVLHTIRRRSNSIGTSNESRLFRWRGRIAMETHRRLLELNASDAVMEECAGMLMKAARGLVLSHPGEAREFEDMAFRIHPTGGGHLAYSRKSLVLRRVLGTYLFERARKLWTELM